nr:ATP-binding protein [Sphingomonas beigongshangi]
MVNSAIRDRHLHAEAQNVVVTGETGVGKSEIMKRILAANPERRDPDTGSIVRPVLYVDVRNSSTPKAVAQAMLVQLMTFEGKALVDPKKLIDSTKSLGVPELTRRVKTLMMGQGVIAALLDEFHNTVSDNGTDRLNRIASWVKDFAKSKSRSGASPDGDLSEIIVFVLIGTKKVERIIDPALNDELASITPYRQVVHRYRYETDDEKAAFQGLLAEIDDELPFDEHARLDEPSLAEKFHVATFGLLRQLGIIIVKAADLAIEDGSDRVREHHLHAAVELKRGVLESHLMSAEAEGEERRIVDNPFKAPEMVTRQKPSGKRGWKP